MTSRVVARLRIYSIGLRSDRLRIGIAMVAGLALGWVLAPAGYALLGALVLYVPALSVLAAAAVSQHRRVLSAVLASLAVAIGLTAGELVLYRAFIFEDPLRLILNTFVLTSIIVALGAGSGWAAKLVAGSRPAGRQP